MDKRGIALLLCLGVGTVLAAASQEGQIEGKVSKVLDDRVRIALEKGGVPKVGFQVEIYSPDAQLSGFWLVTGVQGGEATAVKIETLAVPQPGWKVKIYDSGSIAVPESSPPPWDAEKPGIVASADPSVQPADFSKIFGDPPPGAFVSTKGYLVKLPNGRFQEGFDNFRCWAASRGPGREKMIRVYRQWKSGSSKEPFLGLWVEKNDSVMSQIYAMAPGGLIVLGVCPGAAAEKAAMQAGDIILKVGGVFVRDPLVLSETAGKLALEVERDSKILEITLEAEQHE